MQFLYTCLKALVGIALLLTSSKALIAQHYYTPTTVQQGYAPTVQQGYAPTVQQGYTPNTQFGAYPSYPSTGNTGGYYENGNSHPVHATPVAPQLPPVPPTTWNQVVPGEVLAPNTTVVSPSTDFKPAKPAENSSSGQKQFVESEPKSLAETPNTPTLGQTPTETLESIAGSADEAPSNQSPSVNNAEFGDSVTEPVTPAAEPFVSNAETITPTDEPVNPLDDPFGSTVESAEPAADPIATTEPATPKVESAELLETAEPANPAYADIPVDQPDPEPLNQLLRIQSTIDSVLPSLLPAVVSLEGGSGVIVSPQGHILTASHVTKKAGRRIFVRLSDGRSVQATTLGTNINSDTAALKLDGNGPWPFVQMGNSADVELGDWCLTLGYPLSFDRGRPPAIRIGRIIRKSPSRFTADSPIMGGDSGGPMFDLNGGLIAISSRIKSDVTQNLFVPIQKYQTQWNQLASSIDVPRKKTQQPKPYLGILGESDFDRVRIRRVYQNSPAALAGFLENDVIVSFGGQRVKNFDDVSNVLKLRKPGEEVIAQLNRYGMVLNVSVRLGSINGG